MKRLLMATIVLATGTTVFCALRRDTIELRVEADKRRAAWMAQTQSVAQIQTEREQWVERVRQEREELASISTVISPRSMLLRSVEQKGFENLFAEESELLLAELGLNWETTGDFVVVSKSSLARILLAGMKGTDLTEVARAVLAVEPEEVAVVEATAQRVVADYAAWAQTHVQREDPSGAVVAKYTLIMDPQFSQTLSNSFVTGVTAALGQERGKLLLDYCPVWIVAHGMAVSGVRPSPTTLTVKRYSDGNETSLGFEFRQQWLYTSAQISLWQSFPEAFRPVFPNGWTDLAKREGFELPKEFQEKGISK